MVANQIQTFLFLICLSFIFSETSISMSSNSFQKQSAQGSNEYLIRFDDREQDYNSLHVRLDISGSQTPIVIVSKQAGCESDRIFVSTQKYGPINLALSVHDFYSPKLHLCVICKNNQACSYNMELTTQAIVEIPFGEQVSYYVTPNTSQMTLKIVDNNSNNFRLLETSSLTNIWVKGAYLKDVQISGPAVTEAKFTFGKMFYKDYQSGESFNLNIESVEGDLVTVGSLKLNENLKMRVNDLEIMGVLSTKTSLNLREVCLPIEKINNMDKNYLIRINGIIHTKRGEVYRKENTQTYSLQNFQKRIENGLISDSFTMETDYKEQSFCIGMLPDETNDLIFSIQVTSNDLEPQKQIFYSPQIPGLIYTHTLKLNETIIIQSMKPKADWNELNFNMKSSAGYPDFKFTKCINYPDCFMGEVDWHNIENPHHTNGMSSYNIYKKDLGEEYINYNSFSAKQPVMVIKCIKGEDQNESSDVCEFLCATTI